MGYTTDFSGKFNFNKPLCPEDINTLEVFAQERHEGGGYPGLWCQWVPTDDGSALEWDGGEKFYDYVEWLEYLIKHFFTDWGVMLNGEVTWSGEETDDIGKIIVVDNVVTVREGEIDYNEETEERSKKELMAFVIVVGVGMDYNPDMSDEEFKRISKEQNHNFTLETFETIWHDYMFYLAHKRTYLRFIED